MLAGLLAGATGFVWCAIVQHVRWMLWPIDGGPRVLAVLGGPGDVAAQVQGRMPYPAPARVPIPAAISLHPPRVVRVSVDDQGPADVEHVLLAQLVGERMRIVDVNRIGRALRRPATFEFERGEGEPA